MTPNGQIWDPQGSFRWNSLDRPSGEVNVDIPLSLAENTVLDCLERARMAPRHIPAKGYYALRAEEGS